MGWKITKDFISKNRKLEGRGYGATKGRETVPFRLYDDDGNLYFAGEIAVDWLEGFADYAFAPLDWAAELGCTEMKYKDNHWKTL